MSNIRSNQRFNICAIYFSRLFNHKYSIIKCCDKEGKGMLSFQLTSKNQKLAHGAYVQFTESIYPFIYPSPTPLSLYNSLSLIYPD